MGLFRRLRLGSFILLIAIGFGVRLLLQMIVSFIGDSLPDTSAIGTFLHKSE